MVVSTKRKNSLKSKSNSKTRKQFKKFRKSGMKTKKMRGGVGGKGLKGFKNKVSGLFRKSSSKKGVVSSTPVKSSVAQVPIKSTTDNDIKRILGNRPTTRKTETIGDMLKRIGVKSNSNPKNNPNPFMAKRLAKEAALAKSRQLTPEELKVMEEQEEQQMRYIGFPPK